VSTALISIICEDRPGLIAGVTGRSTTSGIKPRDTPWVLARRESHSCWRSCRTASHSSEAGHDLRSATRAQGCQG